MILIKCVFQNSPKSQPIYGQLFLENFLPRTFKMLTPVTLALGQIS